MEEALQNAFAPSGSWLSWAKIGSKKAGNTANLTLRLADYLRSEFDRHNLEHDPVFIIGSARRASMERGAAFPELWARIEDEACQVVFGSNLIENVGAGLDYTTNLCREMFCGKAVDPAEISSGEKEYADLLDDFKRRGKQVNQPAIIRTRREIIQHAQALCWAVDNIVLAGLPWTEEAVKKVHALLYGDMGNDEIVPGEYRGPDHPIAASYTDPKTGKEKLTRFVHPRAVPSYMANWVKALNEDVERAESGIPFDPYDLAAKHYHHFINIHPFGDDNGRTSRIILNCLALKFTGHFVPIGEDDMERNEFLAIAVKGAKKYHEEDNEVALDGQKGHREMAEFMARKSMKSLKRMWAWAKKT